MGKDSEKKKKKTKKRRDVSSDEEEVQGPELTNIMQIMEQQQRYPLTYSMPAVPSHGLVVVNASVRAACPLQCTYCAGTSMVYVQRVHRIP